MWRARGWRRTRRIGPPRRLSQDDRISDLEQQQGGAQQDAAPRPRPAAQPDTPIAEQLKQLTALHEAGSLTDEEFAAAKGKLLGI